MDFVSKPSLLGKWYANSNPKNHIIERLVLQNPALFYPQKSYSRARIKFCALHISRSSILVAY
jgi:hypothetical protein